MNYWMSQNSVIRSFSYGGISGKMSRVFERIQFK